MKIKIYRGTHEIGGTCIKITANNGKTLLVDFGSPLTDDNPNIDYAKNIKADALLVSHAHQDHYGLIENVGVKTQIYIGKVTLQLIQTVRTFLREPELKKNFITFTAWKWFTISDTFRIKPYLVDHSSPEAFAFLIEVDDKRIFYSGDFRSTGYKKKVFENLINDPPANIDLFFMEGTMVDRSNQTYPSEQNVSNAIYDVIKGQNNVSFVISSGQNIDRLVSVYKACKRAGKILVIDIYNTIILDILKTHSPNLPVIEWNDIKVYNEPKQIKKITENQPLLERVKREDIGYASLDNPSGYVYFVRYINERFLNALKKKEGQINLIYSQWAGYLTEEHKLYSTDYFLKLKEQGFINFYQIHTSGHATIDKLVLLAKKLNPDMIVPIHTEFPEKMKEALYDEGIRCIEIWKDGNEYEL